MKDVLNGITALNLLGSEQRLLPIRTDLISRNADENEIDEIDESQGVNHTLDKSLWVLITLLTTHYLAHISNPRVRTYDLYH